MDELIKTFIDNNYTDETQHEFYRSFKLFDLFEYNDAYSSLIDIITYQSYTDNNDLIDRFTRDIDSKLDYILKQHKITLVEEATIYDKNEILTSLQLLLDLEDYTPIIVTLEGSEDSSIKLATIISDLCCLDMVKVLSLIESYEEVVLDLLKKFIYSKEELITTMDYSSNHIANNLKEFFTLFGRNNLGAKLIENGLLVGENLETYLPYLDSVIATNDEQTAINVLSILLLTAEGYNNPLKLYREYSLQLLHDLNTISRIEVHIVSMCNKLFEYISHKKTVEVYKT